MHKDLWHRLSIVANIPTVKILVMHSRDLDKGSTRFRVVNYQPFLEASGLSINYVNRQRVSVREVERHDVLFNQKCRLNWLLSWRLRRASPRIVFDFDDAIYTRPRKPYGRFVGGRVRNRLDWWYAHADLVTTSSEYLAAHARRITDRVRVIPMAVDVETWAPTVRAASDKVRIGWAGRPGNLRYLQTIQDELIAVQRARPQVEYAVYSGERPDLALPFQHVSFKPGTEPSFIQSLDIGLLPLPDNEFARGKSPIKAIQYLACGAPVVGNVWGASAEIVTPDVGLDIALHGGWQAALIRLVDDVGLRERLGAAGRAHVMRHHNITNTGPALLAAITGRE